MNEFLKEWWLETTVVVLLIVFSVFTIFYILHKEKQQELNTVNFESYITDKRSTVTLSKGLFFSSLESHAYYVTIGEKEYVVSKNLYERLRFGEKYKITKVYDEIKEIEFEEKVKKPTWGVVQ